MKFIVRIAVAVVLVQLVAGFLLQTKFIFPAESLGKDHKFVDYRGGQEVAIRTDDGITISGILYSPYKSSQVILYFHGNAGNLESWRYEYGELEHLQRDALFIDYRGYGKSEGRISEKGLYLDAKAAYDFLRKKGYADTSIIIYGRSLGTGIAVDLAQGKRTGGLILESPYANLRRMISGMYWYMLPQVTLLYTFDSCEKMRKIESGLLIIHGTKDEVIPIQYGKELFECYDGPKEFYAISGAGHNNLSQFIETKNVIRAFLRPGIFPAVRSHSSE